MKVAELMTREVVTVGVDASLKQVASLLTRHRISGVPVCDDLGRVVGVVTEGDILWKEVGVPTKATGVIDRILESAYGDEQRVDARDAGDAMSAPAITVAPSATVEAAARLMVERCVNRLPVVEDGRLVGIVARADLVRAFNRSDEEIEREISEDVLLHTLWIDPYALSLVVLDGDVTVAGEVENRSTAELVELYIHRVPGVVRVQSKLTWRLDDLSRRTSVAADRIEARLTPRLRSL